MTLPIIQGDKVFCPYCKPRQTVRLVSQQDELSKVIADVSKRFNVEPKANYRLAGTCSGCSTVWLAEEVDPRSNQGRPYAWDRFSPKGQRFKA